MGDSVIYPHMMQTKQAAQTFEANGHDVFEGQPRMIDALDTIEQLAKFDNAAAWKCYHDFMEKNLSGVSIEIKG